MSENAREVIYPLRVLTGSLSWHLESPYLFDHFEVAAWCGCDVLDGASGAKIPFAQTPLSQR